MVGHYMSSNKKHIVILTPGFPENEADINCIPPLQLYILSLKKAYPEYKITIVTLQYPHVRQPFEWNGFQVFPCFKGYSQWKSPLKWRKAVKTIEKIHQQNAIDIIHCFWYTESVLVGKKCRRKFGIPIIVTLMGQDSKKKNKYLKLIKIKDPYIIAISKRQAIEFRESSGLECKGVISWGVDRTDVGIGVGKRDPIVLGVGSLVPIKNYPLFISVMEELKKLKPDIEVRILGGGNMQGALQKMIDDSGLNVNIKLFGEVSRNEVLNHMRECKVLLHTAISEGQGFVFNEALANGMTIVSTPVGIAEESDFWTIADNAQELAKSLDKHLEFESKHELPVSLMKDTVSSYQDCYTEILLK